MLLPTSTKTHVNRKIRDSGTVKNADNFLNLLEGWANMDRIIIENLIVSMLRRMQAVVNARGYHAKY